MTRTQRARDLTITALAEPGYSASHVSQIESERRRPSPAALEFLAEQLGVSARYLRTGIPDDGDVRLAYEVERRGTT